jgi:hypothetical protein
MSSGRLSKGWRTDKIKGFIALGFGCCEPFGMGSGYRVASLSQRAKVLIPRGACLPVDRAARDRRGMAASSRCPRALRCGSARRIGQVC